MLIGLSVLLILLAYKILDSYFCKILASFFTIVAGVERFDFYTGEWAWMIFSAIYIAIGVYMLLMIAYELMENVRGG